MKQPEKQIDVFFTEEKKEVRLEKIIDTLDHFLIVTDIHGIILHSNRKAAEYAQIIVGRNPTVGDSVFDFISVDVREELKNHIKEVLHGDKVKSVLRLTDINRKEHWYEYSLFPFKVTNNSVKELLISGVEVTSWKQTENAIVESEELYRKLISASPYAVLLVDPEARIIFFSMRLLNLLGCETEDEVWGNKITDWIHPEDCPRVLAFIREITQVPDLPEKQFRVNRKDGVQIIVEMSVAPITNKTGDNWGVILVVSDVTSRVNSEKQLQLLHNAVDQSPVSVIITDRSGNIEYVSNAFTLSTGYSFEEVRGKNPRILKSGKMSENIYKELWYTISEGNEWKGELLNRKKDGSLYWEYSTISPVKSPDGKITHFLAVTEDVTTEKKLHKELILAKEKAEESDRLKSAFLANISHEIRTPLNGILGFTDLLNTSFESPERMQSYVDMVKRCSHQLLNIMTDILEISMITTNQVRLFPVEISLPDLVNELHDWARDFLFEKDKKSIQLIPVIPKQVLGKMYMDETKLERVLNNLLNNAMKFTRFGKIEFGFEYPNDSQIRFFVKDTGIGIPSNKQSIIFEPFRQLNDSVTRVYGGNGLGLTISKALVEKLGGRIYLESEPGKGSAFFIEFNISNKKQETDLAPRKKSGKFDWSDKKFLIVEDTYTNYVLLKEFLRETSARLLFAKSGRNAIDQLASNPDTEVVLLDIRLPDINGYDVANQMRQLNENIIIIAQTAFPSEPDSESLHMHNCNVVLTKPINKEELLSTIYKLLTEEK